ncbi:ribosome recycling factor [bacterium]|nr:ribosome recycling factor [bacterium]
MIDDIFDDLTAQMEKTIEAFGRELAKTRTGRANPLVLEGIRVDYYGQATPINQMATVSVPEPRLIVIVPWDASQVGAIEKAIQKQSADLNPTNDGKVVRIAFPPLTEDRRKDIVKQIKKMAEDTRVQVRLHRREANDMLKALEKDGDIPEDESRKAQERVQKVHDDYIKKVDDIASRREKDVMEI